MVKKIGLSIFLGLNFLGVSQACIDCTGVGSDIVFTGSVTAGVFLGPTITTITARLNAQVASTGIVNGTIQNIDIGDNIIGQSKLGPEIILSSNIANNSILGLNLGPEIITSSNIANNTIGSVKLGLNIVRSTHIFSQSIDGSHISSGAQVVVTSIQVRGDITSTGTFRGNILQIDTGTISGHVIIGSATVIGTITTTSTVKLASNASLRGVLYTFPSVDGSNGDFLQTDGLGAMSWQPLSSAQDPSTSGVMMDLEISTFNVGGSSLNIKASYVDVMGNFYVSIATVINLAKLNEGGVVDGSTGVANTWYSLFFLASASTVTVVASSGIVYQPLNFINPEGGNYSKWRRFGTVKVQADGSILKYYRRGDQVTFSDGIVIIDGTTPPTTYTKSSLTDYLPATAKSVYMSIYFGRTGASANIYYRVKPYGYIKSNDNYDFEWREESGAAHVATSSLGISEMPFYGSLAFERKAPANQDAEHISIMGYTESGF